MQEIFFKIKDIVKEYQIISLNRKIQVIENLFDSNKTIDIAVLGQFKAGKSSFINSFLQIDLLPVGVIPVTSVITRIGYGSEEKTIIKFLDGTSLEESLEGIKDYIDESKNPGNIRKVLIVDIFLPSLFPYNGLRIVDTPGMGSYFKHNTETTIDWTPEVGFSILSISAERPLSENEMSLLKDLTNYSPKIIILLTKTDLFSINQLNEIKEYIQKAVEKEFGKSFDIYEYSIINNIDLYRNSIKEGIIEPILKNLNFEFESIINHKIGNLRKETLNYLELLRQTSLNSEEEKLKIKNLIIDERLNNELITRELRLISDSYTDQTRDQLVNILNDFKPEVYSKMLEKFEIEFENFKGHLGKLTRKYEKWSADFLRSELFEISDKNHFTLLTNLNQSQKHFANYLKSFRDKLNHNLEKVLGVTLESEPWQIDITNIKQPDISIGRSFDFQLDLLWFLFPMFIFKKIFLRHFKKEIYSLVEINFSRLASDYTERINKEILKIEKQSYSYIEIELSTIESILLNSNSELVRIETAILTLSSN